MQCWTLICHRRGLSRRLRSKDRQMVSRCSMFGNMYVTDLLQHGVHYTLIAACNSNIAPGRWQLRLRHKYKTKRLQNSCELVRPAILTITTLRPSASSQLQLAGGRSDVASHVCQHPDIIAEQTQSTVCTAQPVCRRPAGSGARQALLCAGPSCSLSQLPGCPAAAAAALPPVDGQ